MHRAQRYRVSRAIAQALFDQGYSENDLDTYMRAFGVHVQYSCTDNETLVNYALRTLGEAEEASITEMAQDLGIHAQPLPSQNPPHLWKDTDQVRLFISHLAKDKDKAIRMRECLLPLRISGFVAHEDIRPTEIWRPEIERALHTMDAFLALLTPGFSASTWTQQEVGFAVARGVKIIPLKLGEDPTGFIYESQALPRRDRRAEDLADEVLTIISADPNISMRLW